MVVIGGRIRPYVSTSSAPYSGLLLLWLGIPYQINADTGGVDDGEVAIAREHAALERSRR